MTVTFLSGPQQTGRALERLVALAKHVALLSVPALNPEAFLHKPRLTDMG